MSNDTLWRVVQASHKALQLQCSEFGPSSRELSGASNLMTQLLHLKQEIDPDQVESHVKLSSQLHQMSSLLKSKVSEFSNTTDALKAHISVQDNTITDLRKAIQTNQESLKCKNTEIDSLRSLLSQYEGETTSLRQQLSDQSKIIEDQSDTIDKLLFQVQRLDNACVIYEEKLSKPPKLTSTRKSRKKAP
ncbi:hypothetical protein GEMRC1_002695 [Eukaryota sp. GEM-RC1]